MVTLQPIPTHVVVETRPLADPRVSPDSTRLVFVTREAAGTRLALVDLASGLERRVAAKVAPMSSHPSSGVTFDWFPDGESLAYAANNGSLRHVNLATGIESELCAAHMPLVEPAVSPDGSRIACVADDGRAIAVVDGVNSTTWPTRLSGDADFVCDPAWSPDGEAVAWHEWDDPDMPWDRSRIVVRRADASTPIVVVFDQANVSVGQPRWLPDGSGLVFISDSGGSWNLWSVAVDHKTGEVGEPLCLYVDDCEHAFPQWGAGQRSFAVGPSGERIAFLRNEGGFVRLNLLSVATGAVTEVDRGVFAGLHWKGDVLTAVRSGARTPTQVVTYDTSQSNVRSTRRTIAVGPSVGIDTEALVEPSLIEWRGDDGMVLHGRLYEPTHIENPAGAPLLCWVHGGPTDQTLVAWNMRFAYFLSRGWSIVVPDHRGSTGWGSTYRSAMNGKWGVVDADDCAAAVRHCIENHRVDARRVAAIGGSAGGLTVLMLLARHPVLFAAGVAAYPVSDLVSLAEHTWRFEKHYTDTLVAPFATERATLIERSPLAHAGRIMSPLLVLHGVDDAVVGIEQSRNLVAAMQRAGNLAELVEYQGEGHGFSRPETIVDELTRTDEHLRRYVLDIPSR